MAQSVPTGAEQIAHRRQLRQGGITPKIARRETAHGSGLGRYRWVVEPLSPGYTNSAVCPSATTDEQTSTKASSPSAAA